MEDGRGRQRPAHHEQGSETHTHMLCNEETALPSLTDDVNVHTLILSRIEEIEASLKTPIPTYSMFCSDAFKKMPTVTCMVDTTPVLFLVDSGATHSVLQSSVMTPKLSGRFTYSTGASGLTVKEQFSVPLSCSLQGLKCKHSSFPRIVP